MPVRSVLLIHLCSACFDRTELYGDNQRALARPVTGDGGEGPHVRGERDNSRGEVLTANARTGWDHDLVACQEWWQAADRFRLRSQSRLWRNSKSMDEPSELLRSLREAQRSMQRASDPDDGGRYTFGATAYAEAAVIEYLTKRFGEQDDALGNWPRDWHECPEAFDLYQRKISEFHAAHARGILSEVEGDLTREKTKPLTTEEWLWRLDTIEKEIAETPELANLYVAFTVKQGSDFDSRDFDGFPFGQAVSVFGSVAPGWVDEQNCMWFDLGTRTLRFIVRWSLYHEEWSLHTRLPQEALRGDGEHVYARESLEWSVWHYLRGDSDLRPKEHVWSLQSKIVNIEQAILECVANSPSAVLDEIGPFAELECWPTVLLLCNTSAV